MKKIKNQMMPSKQSLRLCYEGDAALQRVCEPVGKVTAEICDLMDQMMLFLESKPGAAAVAANQLGIFKRLIAVNFCGCRGSFADPVILSEEGSRICIEGCLSYPGRKIRTLRPQRVQIYALNDKGNAVTFFAEGELAKCFCHEIEHLDGRCFLDHAVDFY